MNVEQNGKKLWHIQNTNILFDNVPYDLFLWAKNEPTQEELAKAFRKDYGNDERMVKEWLTSSKVYVVCAYEMNDVMQHDDGDKE